MVVLAGWPTPLLTAHTQLTDRSINRGFQKTTTVCRAGCALVCVWSSRCVLAGSNVIRSSATTSPGHRLRLEKNCVLGHLALRLAIAAVVVVAVSSRVTFVRYRTDLTEFEKIQRKRLQRGHGANSWSCDDIRTEKDNCQNGFDFAVPLVTHASLLERFHCIPTADGAEMNNDNGSRTVSHVIVGGKKTATLLSSACHCRGPRCSFNRIDFSISIRFRLWIPGDRTHSTTFSECRTKTRDVIHNDSPFSVFFALPFSCALQLIIIIIIIIITIIRQ